MLALVYWSKAKIRKLLYYGTFFEEYTRFFSHPVPVGEPVPLSAEGAFSPPPPLASLADYSFQLIQLSSFQRDATSSLPMKEATKCPDVSSPHNVSDAVDVLKQLLRMMLMLFHLQKTCR